MRVPLSFPQNNNLADKAKSNFFLVLVLKYQLKKYIKLKIKNNK